MTSPRAFRRPWRTPKQPSAWVLVQDDDAAPTATGAAVERREVPLEKLADYVSERGNPGNERRIVSAEVLLPREILRGGLQLIDSPGVGGLDSSNALATLSALSSAHAVLLVSDASQEYTEPEVQFLKHAMRISPNVAAVLAKTDLYPEWRQIEQIDRGHLSDVGDVPIFSVSSDLRLLAAELQDRALNDESGFPALVAHLRREVLGRAETIHERSAVHDLVSVVEQLDDLAAHGAQRDPAPRRHPAHDRAARGGQSPRRRVPRALRALAGDAHRRHRRPHRGHGARPARPAAQGAARGGARPSKRATLGRSGIRSPSGSTSGWRRRCRRHSSGPTSARAGCRKRSPTCSARASPSIPAIDVGDTQGVLDAVEQMSPLDPGRLGAAEKIYIGVRGSYGGVLMVGLATGLIGLSLINPFSLLAGVLVGRRAYREDMNARLSRRQQEARNLVRRYIDEVTFQVGKQLKDRLRLVQRAARDHFGSMAEELHRSLTDALNAAKQAAGTYASKRDERVAQLQRQLEQLETLRKGIPALPALPALDRPSQQRLASGAVRQ